MENFEAEVLTGGGESPSAPAPPRFGHFIEEAAIDRRGLLVLRGWAAGNPPIAAIDVIVDGTPLAGLRCFLPRADVAADHPDFPDAGNSGFAMATMVPGARKRDAPPALLLRCHPEAGPPQDISVALARADALAPPADLAAIPREPTPGLGLPPTQQLLEEAAVDVRGVLRVRGWVISLAPVEEIRVFLDSQFLGIAQRDLPREDVGTAHPEYPAAGQSGFLFARELSDDEMAGKAIRVVASMRGGTSREMALKLALPETIRRRRNRGGGVRFHCDTVQLFEDGHIFIDGWAVCPSGVAEIVIALNDIVLGQAELGGDRPDVGNHFPLIPSARHAGYRFNGHAPAPCEGEYVVAVTIRGKNAEQEVFPVPAQALPSTAGIVAGQDAQPGDGGIRFFIDSPLAQNGVVPDIVRGGLTVQGWAVAPAGIALAEVFLDGVSLGPAYYGIRRHDIQQAFPDMANSLQAGLSAYITQKAMPPGQHQIRVVVHDKAGGTAQNSFSVTVEPPIEADGPWSLRRRIGGAEWQLARAMLAAADHHPFYTLLLRLPDAEDATLALAETTLSSLRTQAYAQWRVQIAGPDTGDWPARLHASHADLANQIEIIAPAPNTKLAELLAAEAGLCILLRPGDTLGVDALLEAALRQADSLDAEFFYSDERRIDPASGKMAAFFKPDWSPDLLLSTNYIGRLWAAKTALLERVGATWQDLARHGEYDLVLRLTEQARGIVHIRKVLALRGPARIDKPAQERDALRRAMQRAGTKGEIFAGCLPGIYRVQRQVKTQGLVSIIIPTIAARGLVKITIDSIREKTRYRNFEIICIDNIPKTMPDWKSWLRENADKIVKIPEKFNWSRFNNKGAAQASGEFLLFLNDDIEILDADWLHALLEHAERPEVGVVGPQLLYPNGRVQHAGMFLGESSGHHAFRFADGDAPGGFGLALTQRNMIAVTGACMLIRRSAFDALGGFDEAHSVVNNDLDYCLRAWQAGQRVVYTPHTKLIHHELASRAEMKDVYDNSRFMKDWGRLFRQGDPFFNPNLSVENTDYSANDEPVEIVYAGHPVIAHADVRRILVVKVDHIGDFITGIPAFNRLRVQFPQAEICVLASTASRSLADMVPAIDRVIEFNYFHARSERGKRKIPAREMRALAETLAGERFDLALDLRVQPDTRELLRISGATWLAGYDYKGQFPWLDIYLEWEVDTINKNKRTHISDMFIQLVDTIAGACNPDRNVLPQTTSRAEARAAIATLPAIAPLADILFAGPLVCVHPGVGTPTRQWPTQHFAALIDLLVAGEGAKVVLIGGPDEKKIADQVLEDVLHQDSVFSLIGKTRLRDLPDVLRASHLYVGNNSGPHHMAAALGVPTVGVHSGVVDTIEWGPLGSQAVAMRRSMSCSPCYKANLEDCQRGMACLQGLFPGDVYRACQRMLALSLRGGTK